MEITCGLWLLFITSVQIKFFSLINNKHVLVFFFFFFTTAIFFFFVSVLGKRRGHDTALEALGHA